MNPPLGVRRLFVRPNNRSYMRTEELLCPCCGHLTRVEWEQESLRPGQPFIIQTHCERKGCPAYFCSLNIDAFFEQYGQTDSDKEGSAR